MRWLAIWIKYLREGGWVWRRGGWSRERYIWDMRVGWEGAVDVDTAVDNLKLDKKEEDEDWLKKMEKG